MPDTPAPLALPSRHGVVRSVSGLVTLFRTVAFWLAVALPAAYPVVLSTRIGLLPPLLAGHAVAVAAGHGHQPGDGPLPLDRRH